MPSAYLKSADLANYGVPSATPAQISQASVLIDAYLLRPHGLIYVPDSSGAPCYMEAVDPEYTFNSVPSIAPGSNVQVQVTGPIDLLQVGDTFVIDRAVPSSMETVQVVSIVNDSVILSKVSKSHLANCPMETGLHITEMRNIPRGRSETMLSYVPVARLIGGTGRYSYGRRGDSPSANMDNFNLIASINKFGGPPAWEMWPVNNSAGVDRVTGNLWIPAGIMLAYYSDVKVRYVAGFTYTNLPPQIKMACANLIQTITTNPQQFGNMKSYTAGDTKIEQFAASAISDDVKRMLQPWRSRSFV